MSISKEERERITRFAGTVDGQAARIQEYPEDYDTESLELAHNAITLAGDVVRLFNDLDGADFAPQSTKNTYPLAACHCCGLGYRLRDMRVIEDVEAEDEVLCEGCYRKYCDELNEALSEVPYE